MPKGKATKALYDLQKEYVEFMFGKNQCDHCLHFIDGRRCKAFDEIPYEIIEGEHDHREPFPGDRGIQFEAKD